MDVEELQSLFEKYRDTLIIVEGRNDEKALIELGFRCIITITRPRFEVVEQVTNSRHKKVCILTDFDEEGRKHYRYFRDAFSWAGIHIDPTLRQAIKETGVQCIEKLAKFINRSQGF